MPPILALAQMASMAAIWSVEEKAGRRYQALEIGGAFDGGAEAGELRLHGIDRFVFLGEVEQGAGIASRDASNCLICACHDPSSFCLRKRPATGIEPLEFREVCTQNAHLRSEACFAARVGYHSGKGLATGLWRRIDARRKRRARAALLPAAPRKSMCAKPQRRDLLRATCPSW